MKKCKVEGKGLKSFEVEFKELNLTQRAELNDLIYDDSTEKNFSFWLHIIRAGTYLSDDDIHEYSNEELYAIGARVIVEMNKKKLKK
tara:strand:- start:432 stop:692 length:261 start_codon:yes stop_codon:yes gene_type:complete